MTRFQATCCGQTYDWSVFADHLKAEHPRGVRCHGGHFIGRDLCDGDRSHTETTLRSDSIRVPKTLRPAALTKIEKEWLGATVEGAPELLGRVGQVWAESGLSQKRGHVWVVIPNHDGTANEVVEASVDRLTRTAGAQESLFEDAAA